MNTNSYGPGYWEQNLQSTYHWTKQHSEKYNIDELPKVQPNPDLPLFLALTGRVFHTRERSVFVNAEQYTRYRHAFQQDQPGDWRASIRLEGEQISWRRPLASARTPLSGVFGVSYRTNVTAHYSSYANFQEDFTRKEVSPEVFEQAVGSFLSQLDRQADYLAELPHNCPAGGPRCLDL